MGSHSKDAGRKPGVCARTTAAVGAGWEKLANNKNMEQWLFGRKLGENVSCKLTQPFGIMKEKFKLLVFPVKYMQSERFQGYPLALSGNGSKMR